MRTSAVHHRVTAAAAVVGAAFALGACGTQTAPGLQTPSVAPTSATSAPSSSSGSSSSSSSSSDTSSSSSSAPQSSAGAVCKTDSTIGPEYSATVPTKPFGTTTQVSDDLERTVQVSPSKPRQVTPVDPENAYLDPGMQVVVVDVRTHLVAGNSLYMSYIDFNLSDADHRLCYRTSSSSILPEPQQLQGVTLNAGNKDGNGAVIFQVPVGSDLNSFTLTFSETSDETPQAQWKG